MKFCDLDIQYDLLKKDIDTQISTVLDHKWFVGGPEIAKLEEMLCQRVGSKYAASVSSGTTGLLVALMGLGVKRGDWVITTPFTFAATVGTIAFLGAKPLMVDIEEDTFNIDSKKVSSLLENPIDPATGEKIPSENIKGIVVVNLFGQCADFDSIRAAIGENRFILEDAAQSFGASNNGRFSCTLGDVAVTSFFPSKPLACYGDGGMIFTNNSFLHEKMKMMINHGQRKKYEHAIIGLNFRMDTIQSAILLAKAKPFFEKEIASRNLVAQRYNIGLFDLEHNGNIRLPIVKEENVSVFAQYSILVENGLRDALKTALADKDIPTAIHYPIPLHLQPAFSYLGYSDGDFPIAEKVSQKIISLPFDPYKTEEEILLVCRHIASFFMEHTAQTTVQ